MSRERREQFLAQSVRNSEAGSSLTPEQIRKELASKFYGLHIPVIAIWDAEGNIDVAAQAELCRWVARGSRGLFGGGSSAGGGESYFKPEHTSILVGIMVGVRKEQGREDNLLIEYGAYGYTAEAAARFAHAGRAAGGDLAVVPPPYFKYNPETAKVQLPTGDKKAMDDYVLSFYIRLAEETKGEPFVIYNIPGACSKVPGIFPEGYSISPELFSRILALVSSAIGGKDSGQIGEGTRKLAEIADYYAKLRNEPINVLSGFFPTRGAFPGAKGGVPIERNNLHLIPRVQWQAILAGDYPVVETIQDTSQRFLNWVVGGLEKKGFPELVRGPIYYAHLNGIGEGHMPPGVPPLSRELQKQIQEIWKEFRDERQVLLKASVPRRYIKEAETAVA